MIQSLALWNTYFCLKMPDSEKEKRIREAKLRRGRQVLREKIKAKSKRQISINHDTSISLPKDPFREVTLPDLIQHVKSLYPDGKKIKKKKDEDDEDDGSGSPKPNTPHNSFNVKDPQALIASLQELQDIVGHEPLKRSITLQVSSLIVLEPKRGTMLNTILCGPPGVGKSRIGEILANIWTSLGYLKGPKVMMEGGESENDNSGSSSAPATSMALIIIAVILLYVAFVLYSSFSPYLSSTYALILVGVVIFLISAVGCWWYWSASSSPKLVSTRNSNNPFDKDGLAQSNPPKTNAPAPIEIVSRDDFVGGYQGHTAMKTKAILNRCRGKVLFVDEAYTLIEQDKDGFGKEALDTLNLYLSQHPDEIIVIFAGYKEDLNKLLKAQRGLKRRFMTKFECDHYTADELSKIFLIQLRKDGMNVEDENEVVKFLKGKRQSFPGNGGDTDRLCYLCRLVYSNDILVGGKKNNMKISTDQLKRALMMLEENNKMDEGDEKKEVELHGDERINSEGRKGLMGKKEMFDNMMRQLESEVS
jgi:hypothetical protein